MFNITDTQSKYFQDIWLTILSNYSKTAVRSKPVHLYVSRQINVYFAAENSDKKPCYCCCFFFCIIFYHLIGD